MGSGQRFAGKDLLPDLATQVNSLLSALLIEVLLTTFFFILIMAATDKRAPAGFAPISIGLALTPILLISIPVTNTSVNPAHSTRGALFAETEALRQLGLFWLAPILGAVIGSLIYTFVAQSKTTS
jgi:aquaporin Z